MEVLQGILRENHVSKEESAKAEAPMSLNLFLFGLIMYYGCYWC